MLCLLLYSYIITGNVNVYMYIIYEPTHYCVFCIMKSDIFVTMRFMALSLHILRLAVTLYYYCYDIHVTAMVVSIPQCVA